jgi:misacylated tRNA(Ala) deacylase
MTTRLYLEDPYRQESDAEVLESADGWCVLSSTVFFPGGGGQPADRGQLVVGTERLAVTDVREDGAGRIWHSVGRDLASGQAVRACLDWPYRHALMRHHGLMHLVNTVARNELGALITGVQLGPERSRIDLKLAELSREQIPELEAHVNEVIARDLAISHADITEEEFRRRPELIRTLNVLPPVVGGHVRVVGIEGFDAQACGGTHVRSTGEIGRARVVKLDNKGKDNKRSYWELSAPGAPPTA